MTDKPRVWVSRPTFPDIVARLDEHFEVTCEPEEITFSPAELAAKLADQDAAIVGLKEHIGATEVAGAKRLRLVANLSVGYDNLDLAALTAAGIAASNTADVLNESVADYTWALLLGAARRVSAAERWVRAGEWKATKFTQWLGMDVRGRTLGILGMGRIGQAVARRAQGFGMQVIYHNRSALPAAVARLAKVFTKTDGNLRALALALIDMPEAWSTPLAKMRSPFDYVAAIRRAAGLSLAADPGQSLGWLNALGEPLWQPPGPNGFSDQADSWASAEGMKIRLDIAWQADRQVKDMGNPNDMLDALIGPAASPETRQAVARAESKQQGLALLLMAPEFQRR